MMSSTMMGAKHLFFTDMIVLMLLGEHLSAAGIAGLFLGTERAKLHYHFVKELFLMFVFTFLYFRAEHNNERNTFLYVEGSNF